MNKKDSIKIDLFIADCLKSYKALIFLCLFFFTLSVYRVLTSIPLYESNIKVSVEYNEAENNFGGLASLSGLTGMSFPTKSNSTYLSTDLFGIITKSDYFLLTLLQSPISVEEISYSSLSDYLINVYYEEDYSDLNVSSSYYENFNLSSTFISLDVNYRSLLRLLSSLYDIEYDTGLNIVNVSCKTSIPEFSAHLCSLIIDSFQNELINHRLIRLVQIRKNLEFKLDSLNMKKEDLQQFYFDFKQRNINVVRDNIIYNSNQLENRLSYYSEASKTMEIELLNNSIDIANETPVFGFLTKINIPYQKTGIRGIVIIILFQFLALIIFIFGVLLIKPIKQILGKTKYHFKNSG